MKNIKYFIQYIIILVLFIFYKLLGLRYSRIVSAQIFRIFGPFFRSNKISDENLERAFDNLDKNSIKLIRLIRSKRVMMSLFTIATIPCLDFREP